MDSSPRLPAESQRLSSRTDQSHQLSTLGTSSATRKYQRPWTGERLTVSTIFHGTRISTSQFTADPSGPKELPHLLLIDSTLCSRTRTQLQLLLTLRLLLTAEPVDLAMEETQVVSTSSPTRSVSQTLPASNTLPRTA